MDLGADLLALLFIAAILTSLINVVAAVGGGMTLFAIMITFLDYAIVVPMHGIVQLWSSGTRNWVFRKHVNYKLVGYFLITFIPSAILGAFLWKLLIETENLQPYLKILIAVYLILFLNGLSIKIRTTDRGKLMLWAGAWSGTFALIAGSPAPVMAPFFIKADVEKRVFIGTWAACGVFIQLSKIPLFLFIWDKINIDHAWLIALLASGVVIGVYVGKAVLGKISEELFRKLLKIILSIIGLKLIIWDGLRVIYLTNS